MADIVTGTVTGQVDVTDLLRDHSDIRQEVADEGRTTVDAVKTAAWHNSDRTGTEADRIVQQATAQFIASQQYAFDSARDMAALKSTTDAAVAATLAAIQLSTERSTAAAALEASKTAASLALGHAAINQQIVADGNATRALINSIKMDDLNRALIERNTELVAEKDRGLYWNGQFNNAQYSQLVSQVNAMNSQLTETRQGMVNFGTMAGVGQSSTSNNVR